MGKGVPNLFPVPIAYKELVKMAKAIQPVVPVRGIEAVTHHS
jgi:hypothetical protein